MGVQPRGEKRVWNGILSIPVASPCASPQPDSRQQAAASVLNNRARFFVAVCDSRASAAIFAGQVVLKSANGSSIPTPRPLPGAATAMHMCRLHTERMGWPPVCRGQRQPLATANTRKRRRTYAVDAAHGELGVVWRKRGGRHLVGAIRGLHQRRQVLQPHGNRGLQGFGWSKRQSTNRRINETRWALSALPLRGAQLSELDAAMAEDAKARGNDLYSAGKHKVRLGAAGGGACEGSRRALVACSAGIGAGDVADGAFAGGMFGVRGLVFAGAWVS